MEVALYARVSTTRQQQHQTIEQQLSRLRDYVATHPDWYVADEHIYRDDGYSGATLKRPGLDRLRDRAAMAAFACVLITAPDRLARNYVHQMLLVDELTQRGCRVEFVERPMSDDPHDQLLLQIRSAVAEYERTLIAERMRRGRQAKLRSGQLLPWTRAPYGYLLDPDRPRDPSRVRIDPVQAAVVEQMFAWYTDPGQTPSLYQVAKRLSEAQIPTPRGGNRWNVASVRGILRSPTYTGVAYSGRTRPAPARRRKSALQPVGPGQSQQPAPVEEWIAVPVPALISEAAFEAAQHRLDRNVQMARRNNTTYAYLLRGLVSCGRCRLTCGGRTLHPGYHYYFCRGRTDSLRVALGERCTARYAPAQTLDELVWQDLCRVLREPALITYELERAQMGAWLPQALQARRQTLRDVLAQLERQQARLLDLYLAEVIEREEFERRRKEVAQSQHGFMQHLRQLDAQAQQHVNVAALAQGIEAFGQRMQPTLDQLTFAQRRQLVELLIDRVIVNDSQVEIRYVVPTGPKGETTPFCHLRLDYFDPKPFRIHATCLVCGGHIRAQIKRVFVPFRPTTEEHNRPILGFRHAHIAQLDEGSRLDTGAHGCTPEALPGPQDGDVAARPDHVGPAIGLQRMLERGAIELAIAQEYHWRPRGNQLMDLLDQRDMEIFGEVALLAGAHQPREREGSPFIDQREHQCHAAAPDDTPINDQHQRLHGELPQQDLGIRDKIHRLRDRAVADPPGKAFDPALGFGAIGHLGRDLGQVRTFTPDDAADQRGQGRQVPGDRTCRLARIPLSEGVLYGTISAEVVTHELLLLDWSHFPEEYTRVTTS